MPKQDNSQILERKEGESDEDFKKRKEEANKTTQLLEPRIIEIQIN
jgi:hypothetical protein